MAAIKSELSQLISEMREKNKSLATANENDNHDTKKSINSSTSIIDLEPERNDMNIPRSELLSGNSLQDKGSKLMQYENDGIFFGNPPIDVSEESLEFDCLSPNIENECNSVPKTLSDQRKPFKEKKAPKTVHARKSFLKCLEDSDDEDIEESEEEEDCGYLKVSNETAMKIDELPCDSDADSDVSCVVSYFQCISYDQ